MEKSKLIRGKPFFPKRDRFRFILIVAMLAAANTVLAQDRSTADYDVEAAFLSNLGKFVQWPQKAFPSPGASIVIGLYGENPFRNALNEIVNGRTINGHQIIVQTVSINTVQNCQVLFVCPSEQKNLSAIIRKLDGACVLTVTENIDPFKSGAMVNFIRKNHQIRFEINDAAARKVGLKISSKLLTLAAKKTVRRETSEQQALLCDRSP